MLGLGQGPQHCGAGASYNALNRYRMALIGLFAVATMLHMWAANITLNLAGGSKPCSDTISQDCVPPFPKSSYDRTLSSRVQS